MGSHQKSTQTQGELGGIDCFVSRNKIICKFQLSDFLLGVYLGHPLIIGFGVQERCGWIFVVLLNDNVRLHIKLCWCVSNPKRGLRWGLPSVVLCDSTISNMCMAMLTVCRIIGRTSSLHGHESGGWWSFIRIFEAIHSVPRVGLIVQRVHLDFVHHTLQPKNQLSAIALSTRNLWCHKEEDVPKSFVDDT